MILDKELVKKYISKDRKPLDCSYKNITFIEYDAFENLTNLYSLCLSGNQLTTLDHRLFENLTKLGWLFLDDNCLTFIHPFIYLKHDHHLFSAMGELIYGIDLELYNSKVKSIKT